MPINNFNILPMKDTHFGLRCSIPKLNDEFFFFPTLRYTKLPSYHFTNMSELDHD